MPRTPSVALSLTLALALGCAHPSGGHVAAYTDVGVTPGGEQDMALARDIIAQGGIPARSHFSPEGLFSEHDLPLNGADCLDLLCPRAAAARVDPVDNQGEGMLLQLGFASGLDLATFERPALDLAVAVDVSGSMAGEKLDAVRVALHTLVDQLDEGDTLALVGFDDRVHVRQISIPMDAAGRAAVHDKIDRLQALEGTWIEGGLAEAFRQINPERPAGVLGRVMLFTDAQPNIGATDTASFLGMTRAYADQDIGLSVFGVGLDMGAELTRALAQVRGGRAHYLGDAETIETVFSDDFDLMVTPIAYDVDVAFDPAEHWELSEVYGAPTDAAGALTLGAATLFLSRHGGGMGAILRSPDTIELPDTPLLADLAIHYQPAEYLSAYPEGDDGAMSVGWEGGTAYATGDGDVSGPWADDLGVFKMAVLIDELQGLRGAADFCTDDLDLPTAQARITAARARLRASADQVEDRALAREAELLTQLLENLAAGPEACWPAY